MMPSVTFVFFNRIKIEKFVRINKKLFMTVEEYNDCVNLYADGVYRFILKNLRHEEDARDIVQTAFEKVWINHTQVDFAKCKSYLFTIAYNQMIDCIRKNKRVTLKEEISPEAKTTEKPANNIKKILDQALQTLTDIQRTLVLLKDYEGYSYDEIGEITGLSESQVKVYLHRARLQLKSYLVSPHHVI